MDGEEGERKQYSKWILKKDEKDKEKEMNGGVREERKGRVNRRRKKRGSIIKEENAW